MNTTTTSEYNASHTATEFETTTTPNDLCYALQGLTDAQKSNIRDMGFESITSFNIRDIPMGLGRWLLDNYDHKWNELKVGSHIIEITPSKVNDVLGVPMGEIPVSERKKVRSGDAFRNMWRKQSFIRPVVFVQHVIEKLKSYTGGGTLFKLNFLVIFNSIMGETTKSATVNQKFLTSIINEDDIRNMDWCSYIIRCLRRTKEGWNGIKPYNGPLSFLVVLYAHELQLKRGPEKAIIPAIQYVTTGYLANLEGPTYDNIQDNNQSTQNVEVQLMFETDNKSAGEGETASDLNVSVLQDKENEVQPQTHAVDQNVNVPQDDKVQFQSINLDSVLNLKLPNGPQSARSLSSSSANLVHCNRLELPRDKKLHVIFIDDDDDDDDVVMLDTKQGHSVEKLSSNQSGIVCVEGYKVKRGVANILKSILKKHGDIAAKCVLKSNDMRSPYLEAVCEVALRIQATDITVRMEDLESRVSDAKAVKIDVSWLEPHFKNWKEATNMYNLLSKIKPNHLSNIKAAESNLKKRRAELEAAEERSREAKRLMEALHVVGKNLTYNFFESKAKIDSWLMDSIV